MLEMKWWKTTMKKCGGSSNCQEKNLKIRITSRIKIRPQMLMRKLKKLWISIKWTILTKNSPNSCKSSLTKRNKRFKRVNRIIYANLRMKSEILTMKTSDSRQWVKSTGRPYFRHPNTGPHIFQGLQLGKVSLSIWKICLDHYLHCYFEGRAMIVWTKIWTYPHKVKMKETHLFRIFQTSRTPIFQILLLVMTLAKSYLRQITINRNWALFTTTIKAALSISKTWAHFQACMTYLMAEVTRNFSVYYLLSLW
jgi:hypothetical protein